MFNLLVVFTLLLSSLVRAVPFTLTLNDLILNKRDVWAPKITSPVSGSVWPVGSTQTVTWDTSDKPAQVTNPIGRVVLGHVENNSLNLQLDNPLAQNFNLTDGKVQITVPNVPPRSDYIVVLIGNSGNMSPTFAITSITGGSSSSDRVVSTSGSAASSTADASSAATTVTEPIPISGTTITGGSSSSIPPVSSITSPGASATPTASASVTSGVSSPAVSSSASSSASSAGTTSGSAVGAQSSTSGALSLFRAQGSLAMCAGVVSVVMALVF